MKLSDRMFIWKLRMERKFGFFVNTKKSDNKKKGKKKK